MSSRKIKLLYILIILILTIPISSEPQENKLHIYSYKNNTLIWNHYIAIVQKVDSYSILYQDTNDFPPHGNPDWDYHIKKSYHMLSIVGPIVSYMYDYYAEGGAHPSYMPYIETYNLETGKKSSLLDYFSERDILYVLLNDSYIKPLLPNNIEITSLEDFFKNVDGGKKEYIYITLLNSFSFHHINGDKVAVRIGISYPYDGFRGYMKQL